MTLPVKSCVALRVKIAVEKLPWETNGISQAFVSNNPLCFRPPAGPPNNPPNLPECPQQWTPKLDHQPSP